MNIAPPSLSNWLKEYDYIWQMALLTPTELSSLASDRGVRSYSSDIIKNLWQCGILRADLIRSNIEIQLDGVNFIGENASGQRLYADERLLQFPHGLSDIINKLPPLTKDTRLLFHPFRYLVLMYIDGELYPDLNPIQQIISSSGTHKKINHWQTWFNKWTSSKEFPSSLRYHEEVAALCIATEPCTYRFLFSKYRRSVHIDDETFETKNQEYRDELFNHYQNIGIEPIEDARRRLCFAAERLDANRQVHNILRLTTGETRIKEIKDRLGGAMFLLTMAEMLRRFSEYVFETELPEEDELSLGYSLKKLKERDYGANRLFDGNRRVANQYLREFGLDHGIRLRWYVEGDTEFFALKWLFENNSSIELINLRGLFKEKNRLAFIESLKNDKRSQIFSFISFDTDQSENLRVVHQALKKEEKYISVVNIVYSTPNFEDQNFTPSELKNILWGIALENGVSPDDEVKFRHIVSDLESYKDIIGQVRSKFPHMNQENKGEKWGKRLMEYAWNKQTMISKTGSITTRSVIEAAHGALRAPDIDFLWTIRDWKVDPDTGRLSLRPKA